MIANPETGEVHRLSVGERVAFGPNTWHHGFAHGSEPLRVLELYAPPPSAGTSGAHARTRPMLEDVRYGGFTGTEPTLRCIRVSEISWRRDTGVLVGAVDRTEHLEVLELEVNPGDVSETHTHAGDEILYVKEGTLWVRAWYDGQAYAFELDSKDACFLPAGCAHDYRNVDATQALATVGIAPPR